MVIQLKQDLCLPPEITPCTDMRLRCLSMLTLCYLHSYSHVHARTSRAVLTRRPLPPQPGGVTALCTVSTPGQEEVIMCPLYCAGQQPPTGL